MLPKNTGLRKIIAGSCAVLERCFHCVKLEKKIRDQAKDIVCDARPVRELPDEKGAPDLGEEHVSFAKFVPARRLFQPM